MASLLFHDCLKQILSTRIGLQIVLLPSLVFLQRLMIYRGLVLFCFRDSSISIVIALLLYHGSCRDIWLACWGGGLTLFAVGLLLDSHTFRLRSVISLARPVINATIAVVELHQTEQLLIKHHIIIVVLSITTTYSGGQTIPFLVLRNLLGNVILDRFLLLIGLLLVCSCGRLLAMRIDVEIYHITLKLFWLVIFIVRIGPFLLCGDRGWFTGLADLLYEIVCLGLLFDFLAWILGIGVRSGHGWSLAAVDAFFVIVSSPHW